MSDGTSRPPPPELNAAAQKLLEQIVVEFVRKTSKWSNEIVIPDADVCKDGDYLKVRFPFEEANKRHVKLIDEMVRLACVDLTKKKAEKPMEHLARALAIACGDQVAPNNGLELLTARVFNNVYWMDQYRTDNKAMATKELKARSIIK